MVLDLGSLLSQEFARAASFEEKHRRGLVKVLCSQQRTAPSPFHSTTPFASSSASGCRQTTFSTASPRVTLWTGATQAVRPPGSNGSPISSSDQRSLTASIVEGSVESTWSGRASRHTQRAFADDAWMSSVWRADADGTQSWVVQAGLLHAPINESLYTTSSGWPPSRSMTTGRVHRACATSVAAVRW